MERSILRLALALMLAIMGLGAGARAARAATWTVTNTGDDAASGQCTVSSCTLRDAIGNSSNGDIVDATAIEGNITLTHGELLVEKSLTINGSGASALAISGNNANRVVHITGAVTVALSGFTLTDGTEENGGAGLFVDNTSGSPTVSVSNCNIVDNSAPGGTGYAGGGGGIYCNGNSLTLNNCVIADNTTGWFGGGIDDYTGSLNLDNCFVGGNTSWGGGGGICINSSVLTMTNSTVSGNSITTYWGGGAIAAIVPANGTNNSMALTNCTLANNVVNGETLPGGAIYDLYGNEPLAMVNCTVTGNTASGEGGGLYDASYPTLLNTIVAGNIGDSGDDDVTGTFDQTGTFGYNLIGDSGDSAGFSSTNHDQVGTTTTPIPVTSIFQTENGLPVLGANGGPTPTVALIAGSVAIDTGFDTTKSPFFLTTDQRGPGFPRKVGSAVDIGAYEYSTGAPVPTISSFTPTSGPAGTGVIVTGTNFTGATTVKFNGTTTTFTVSSATSISTSVPQGASTGTIAVTTPGGTATSATSFTVPASPTITSFSPTTGKAGTAVTISGTNFTGATAVKFNGASASFTVSSATSISTTVPASATSGTIAVTTPAGIATSGTSFVVPSSPTITSFSPTTGKAGTGVTLTGTNFTGATAVKFNGTSANFTVASATSISTTVPTGATSGTIAVTTPAGTATSATSFILLVAPTLSGFSPATGPVGTAVTLTGTNFTGATAVKFGAVSASFTVKSATSISTTVPAGATTGTISVTTPGGTATSANAFTVILAPTISSFTPTTGPIGTTVTITGTNFTNVTAVKFNTTAATSFTIASATSITAKVPTGAITGKISVTNAATTASSSGTFTVLTAPTITSFTPTSGPVATAVTLTGTNFTGTTSVKFDGITAAFNVVNSTQINTHVPSGAGSGKIVVTTAAGTVTSASAFTVPAPTITSFSPTEGGFGAGVFIYGTGFSDVTQVRFSISPATYIVISPSEIRATIPNGAPTGKIVVITPAGTAISATNFTIIQAPVISEVSPSSGAAGVTVTITGDNFGTAGSVKLNGTACSFSVVSVNTITTRFGTNATSGPFTVTTIGGTATSPKSFTVTTGADKANSQAAASALTLSAASASSASATVTLNFSGALDAASAADAANYSVTVNGATVEVLGASYTATRSSVTLSLPEGASPAGATVAAAWNGVLDAKGHALSGHSGGVTAR